MANSFVVLIIPRIKCCAAKTQVREKMSDRFRGMNVSDSDSSSSGSDSSSDGSMLSASSLPPAEEIMEGKSRPGNWHLYTCVYDGVNSYIRVDGKYEGEGNVGDGGELMLCYCSFVMRRLILF